MSYQQVTSNMIGRRGFVGGSVLAFLLAKNPVLFAACQTTGCVPDLPYDDAISLVLMINTVQLGPQSTDGSFYDAAEALQAVAAHKYATGTEWIKYLMPLNVTNPLPGWTLDFDTDKKTYYKLALHGAKYSWITSFDGGTMSGLIYRAPALKDPPPIKTIKSAADYPGAIVDE